MASVSHESKSTIQLNDEYNLLHACGLKLAEVVESHALAARIKCELAQNLGGMATCDLNAEVIKARVELSCMRDGCPQAKALGDSEYRPVADTARELELKLDEVHGMKQHIIDLFKA